MFFNNVSNNKYVKLISACKNSKISALTSSFDTITIEKKV